MLGSSVPGIEWSRKGAGSTLAMATASKEARAGVKGSQPRADERERFRAFERDSSKVECTLVRGGAVSFAGCRTNADLGGSFGRVGFRPHARGGSRQWVHEQGVEEGTACAQSASGLRSKPLGPRVAVLRKEARWGHTLSMGGAIAHFSRCIARSRKGARRHARGSWGLGLGCRVRSSSSESCPYVGSCCRSR